MTESIIFKKEYDLIKNKLLKSLVFIKNIREQNHKNKHKNPQLYVEIDLNYIHNIEYCLCKFLGIFIENENEKINATENERFSYYYLKKFMYQLNEKLLENLNYIIPNTNTYNFIQSELKKLPLSFRIQLHNMFIKHFKYESESESDSIKLNN